MAGFQTETNDNCAMAYQMHQDVIRKRYLGIIIFRFLQNNTRITFSPLTHRLSIVQCLAVDRSESLKTEVKS